MKYVITAINPLTNEREVMSLPMSRNEAIAAIKAEIAKNAGRTDRIFIKARVCEFDPQQLTFKFEEK